MSLWSSVRLKEPIGWWVSAKSRATQAFRYQIRSYTTLDAHQAHPGARARVEIVALATHIHRGGRVVGGEAQGVAPRAGLRVAK